MLARLGIRRKLGLLLAIPLVAVVLVMVPYTAERINDARAAAVTAGTANAARQIGGLMQILQQERLLALGYLSLPALDRGALLARSAESADQIANLRDDPATADIMAKAEQALFELDQVRQGLANRTVTVSTAYAAFRATSNALLDALNLGRPTGVDAVGLTQLGALDALMRSNEEASSVGAILVAAAADRSLTQLLSDAQTADRQNLRRFRDLVGPGQADLLDAVEDGEAGRRVRELSQSISSSDAEGPIQITEALTAAVTYTDLRRLAQDRVAREIAAAADYRAWQATWIASGVTGGAAVLFVVIVVVGTMVSGSISRPLHRLTRAAAVVAELSGAELRRVADSDSPDPAPPKLAAIEVRSGDEIGELAAALNRVQATAALLLERQASSRRNISVMFTNIARRTQNLAGRQLALIDDLERNERNPELLQQLSRLDHIATRLRRSADSLLVVSGTIDQQLSGTPAPLVEVVRSAVAEIEGFRAVEVGDLGEVAVAASAASDLRLLLAELLENAANFSPPGAGVAVTARLGDGYCEVGIVDHGVGLSEARMAEENRRLVERERLDVAPTTVLGLFVVGRLARRHGLSVRLEPTPDRGVTALVRVPARLLAVGPVSVRQGSLLPARSPAELENPAMRVRPARVVRDMIDAIEVPRPFGSFPWFMSRADLPAIAAPAGVGTATAGSPIEPATPTEGLSRASVGPMSAQPANEPLSADSGLGAGPQVGHPMPAQQDPPASPFGPDAEDTLPSGLVRRVPGTNLSDGVRGLPSAEEPTTTRLPRDPDAERALLNEYLTGLARGGDAVSDRPSQPNLAERPS